MTKLLGRLSLVMICLSMGAPVIYANPYQPGSQQWHDYNGIAQYEADKQRNARQQSRGSSAAEIRAWHEREVKIQAEIARDRATLWWMAIVRNWGRRSMTVAGGYASKQRAIDETMKRCASADCEVLVTFANSCAVIVAATPTPMNSGEFFIGLDPDDTKAAAKAWQAC